MFSVVCLLSALVPLRAWADGIVRSDFVFQLDNSVFKAPEFDLTSKLQGQQAVTLPDLVIQDQAPVQVSGITGQVAYHLKSSSSQIFLGAEQTVMTDQLSVSLTIRQVSVDAIIDQVVGGTVIHAHMQASCSAIPISLVAGAPARIIGSLLASVDSSGLPTLTVPFLTAQWDASAWQIGDFNCTGTAGFKDRVIAGLKNYLGHADSFSANLKSVVDAQVAQYQASIRTWFQTPISIASTGVSGLKIQLHPNRLQNISGNAFQIAGSMDFIFASSTVNDTYEIKGGGASVKTNLYALQMPDGFLNAMNSMAFRTGALAYRIHGQNVDAFKSLLASSVQEFAVWPELSNYPATADFLFDVSTSVLPNLSSITDNGDGTVSGAFSGSLSVLTWAPTASGYVKMVTFRSPLSGTCRLSFTAGSQPTLHFGFSGLTASLSGDWDSTYASHVSNLDIDLPTIQSKITDSFNTDGLNLSLGSLALTSQLSLRPTALSKRVGWFVLQWQ